MSEMSHSVTIDPTSGRYLQRVSYWFPVLTIVLIAAILRLHSLGDISLQRFEADTAVPVVSGLEGQPIDSSLMLSYLLLLEASAGLSNVSARLLPALCGIVLVAVLAMSVRNRIIALSVAFLVGISPGLVLMSRSAVGVMPGLTAAACTYLMLGKFQQSQSRYQLWLAFACLGILATTGFTAWSIFLLFAVGSLLLSKHSFSLHVNATTLVIFAGTALIVATAFLLYPDGVASIGDSFVRYWGSFSFERQSLRNMLIVMAISEPLIVVFGVIGLISVWAEYRDKRPRIAVLVVLYVLLFVTRADTLDFYSVHLFIGAVFAGIGIERIIRHVAESRIDRNQLLASVAAILIAIIILLLQLSYYAYLINSSSEGTANAFYLAGLSSLILLGLIILLIGYNSRLAIAVVSVSILVVLSAHAFGLAWELGDSPSSNVRLLWFEQVTTRGIDSLENSLESWSERGLLSDSSVFINSDHVGSEILWLARDLKTTDSIAKADLVITSPSEDLTAPGNWRKTHFQVAERLILNGISPSGWIRSILNRYPLPAKLPSEITVWVRDN